MALFVYSTVQCCECTTIVWEFLFSFSFFTFTTAAFFCCLTYQCCIMAFTSRVPSCVVHPVSRDYCGFRFLLFQQGIFLLHLKLLQVASRMTVASSCYIVVFTHAHTHQHKFCCHNHELKKQKTKKKM